MGEAIIRKIEQMICTESDSAFQHGDDPGYNDHSGSDDHTKS